MSAERPEAPPLGGEQRVPSPEQTEEERGTNAPPSLVFVEATHIAEAHAADEAERSLTESRENLKGIPGLLKRFWKHNIAVGYYRENAFMRARKRKIETGSFFATTKDDDSEAHQQEANALLERFENAYEGSIQEERGEKRDTLDTTGEQAIGVRKQIGDLIRAYAEGQVDNEAFEEERTRILSSLSNVRGDVVSRRGMYVDNLKEVAEYYRKAHSHGESLAALDETIKVIVGQARDARKTETHFNQVDRIIHGLGRYRLGSYLFNETSAGALVSGAYSIAARFSETVARSNVAKFVSLGVAAGVGGAVAGLRENTRLKQERQYHLRERAANYTFDASRAQRRAEMETSVYDMRDATGITSKLLQPLYEEDENGRHERTITQEEYDQAMADLADLEARIQLSNVRGIDLIRYSSDKTTMRESTALEKARYEAKQILRKKVARGEVQLPGNTEFDEMVRTLTEERKKQLVGEKEAGIEAKDSEFKKLRNKNVTRAVILGATTGLVAGVAVQELKAFFTGQEGLLENVLRGKKDVVSGTAQCTALEYLHRWVSGNAPMLDTASLHEMTIGATTIKLPEGWELTPDAHHPHEYDLVSNGEVVVNDIPFQGNGLLTPEGEALLAEEGVVPHLQTNIVTEMQDGNLTAAEYADQHPDMFSRIKRLLWFDNDTPKPTFDKNELRLDFGGIHNTGIDSNGNYVMSVNRMLPDGSYHKELSVNARELMQSGKLKLLLSLSQESQNAVVEVPIQPNGDVVIDPNSETGKIFFNNIDGKAQFVGRFAEVAEMVDANDGADRVRILATHVGEGIKEIVGEAPVSKEVSELLFEVPQPYDWQPPPVIPIRGRRPLEPSIAPKSKPEASPERKKVSPLPAPELAGAPYYYGSGTMEGILAEFKSRGIARDPYMIVERKGRPRLVDQEGKEPTRSVARERQRIHAYVGTFEDSYKEKLAAMGASLEPMDEKCRVVVNVPARNEAAHLANLLDGYANQIDAAGKPLDPALFELNIIINRRQSEEPDNSEPVINAWKREHPELRVNVLNVVFDDTEAGVGRARKYITDLTLMRSIDRASQEGPLYIESEDADIFGLDKRTIAGLTERFDRNPTIDVLRGIQDRQPEVMANNDLLLFSQRLWNFMEVFNRKKEYRPEKNAAADFMWHRVLSGGWNTAYTAEAYAQIGGYDPTMTVSEDTYIGQKVSILRGAEDRTKQRFVPNTWTARTSGLRSSSSPRRFFMSLATGKGPYDPAAFEDQEVKRLTLEELQEKVSAYAKADQSQRDRYALELQVAADFLNKEVFRGDKRWRDVFNRTLGFMGLHSGTDYRVDGTKIQLTEHGMNHIIELLQHYKKEKTWKKGYRRQHTATPVT